MMVYIPFNFVFRVCRHVFYVVFFYGNEVYISVFCEFICDLLFYVQYI